MIGDADHANSISTLEYRQFSNENNEPLVKGTSGLAAYGHLCHRQSPMVAGD